MTRGFKYTHILRVIVGNKNERRTLADGEPPKKRMVEKMNNYAKTEKERLIAFYGTELRHIAEQCEDVMRAFTDNQNVLDGFRMDFYGWIDIDESYTEDHHDHYRTYTVDVHVFYPFVHESVNEYVLIADYVIEYDWGYSLRFNPDDYEYIVEWDTLTSKDMHVKLKTIEVSGTLSN